MTCGPELSISGSHLHAHLVGDGVEVAATSTRVFSDEDASQPSGTHPAAKVWQPVTCTRVWLCSLLLAFTRLSARGVTGGRKEGIVTVTDGRSPGLHCMPPRAPMLSPCV